LANEAVELARALTGRTLSVAGDATNLPSELIRLGWDHERLAALREERMRERLVWPFPVDLDVRRELGFARFDALLDRVRKEMGLAGTKSQAQAPVRPLNADERRLLADRPPHWG
jgi:hypothetical protein